MVSAYVGMGLRRTHDWTAAVLMQVESLDLCRQVLRILLDDWARDTIQPLARYCREWRA